MAAMDAAVKDGERQTARVVLERAYWHVVGTRRGAELSANDAWASYLIVAAIRDVEREA